MVNKEQFVKMTLLQKENIYGGFNWSVFLPLALQAITQAVASVKMILSDNGSVKTSGYESHWDNKSTSSSTKTSTKAEVKQTNIYYAY